MAEEMRLHLEQRIEEHVASGMSPTDARYAALRQFGGVEQAKEIAREQRGWMWLDHLARDTRHALRQMAKTPLLSSVIVLSLGLGIGVNAVIFSWMNALVFHPVPGSSRAADLLLVEPKLETGSYPGASWPEYRDLAARTTAFDGLAAFKMVPLNLGEAGRDERVYAQFVSANYFTVLGMKPTAGRLLSASDAPAAPSVVISHAFWLARFGGAPDVAGRTLRLNDQIMTIVGVTPEGFMGTVAGLSFDLWVPAELAPVLFRNARELEIRDTRGFTVMGALRPGATRAQAQAEVDATMQSLAKEFPPTNASVRGELMPFWRAPRGAGRMLLTALSVLQGFMVLVLAVVCANAANLLLARATTRRREVGVRLALGARPRQIVQLFVVESLVLGGLAAVLGVIVAMWGTNALRAVPLPGGFPFKFQTDLDALGLTFAVLLGLGCAAIFGLVPALQASRTDSQLALRAGSGGAGRARARSMWVAVESALALLVLIVAALFVRSFEESRTDETGYPKQGVLLAAYDLSGRGYDKASGLTAIDELMRRLRQVPGIESAAIATWVPLDFHAMPVGGFSIDGAPRADGGQDRALTYSVTPGYFDVMGVSFVSGHDFGALDEKDGVPQAIVNEEFARRFLGAASPLGHKIVGRSAFEIIGVVRNTLYETFGEPAKPVMFFSVRERLAWQGQIHVRTRGSEALLAPELRRLVREINPAIAVYDVRTLGEHVDKNLFFRKIPARMFAVIGPLILALAAIGIYAVVAYAVAQRATEIGVRLALGASARQVVGGIVRESLSGVLLGTGVAWFLAVVVTMHMRGGVPSWPVLCGVPGLLISVAAFAAWLPARRAAEVDPVVALRSE